MKTNKQKAFLKYNLLNNLSSPAFYILTLLFTVFLSVNYFIRHQFFTGSGTTDLLLFFSAVPYISIIIIPALCYNQSFTIYDNFIPLKNLEKITLTFICRLILFTVMLLLLMPVTLAVNLFGKIDFGQFFVSYLCLFFYGGAVISLCTFVDKLFSNKISTFVVSALLLGIFNSAHLFAVYVPVPDAIASIFKQLSFAWHFDAASKGILDSRDIVCLLGTAILFILLSDFAEEVKKGKKYTFKSGLPEYAKLALALLIILNGSRWYFRFDFSANKTYSPSKYTKELLRKADSNVKITYYRSNSILKLYPQIRDVTDFLITYSNLNKNISLIIKDPDKDSSTRTLLENYGIQSQQMRTVSSTSTEYVNVYSAITIEYNGNVELLPFTMTASTLEYDLDGRIKHLLTGVSRTVNIIIGNGMTLTEDYSYLTPWLNSQGFICNQLYINDPNFTQNLANSQGPLLIIGDKNVRIEQAIAIEDYILKNKGNALFMVNPYSVDIEENWYLTANKNTNLVEILENWGVIFKPQIAADLSCARITMYAEDNSETQNLNYALWLSILQQKNTTLGLTMFWATPLQLEQNASPYLFTTPLAYTYEVEKGNKETLIETNPFILQTVNAANKEKGTLTIAAEITGPLTGLFNAAETDHSHIIVIPDQYMLNSLMNEYIGGDYGDYRNFEFLTTALLNLCGEEQLAQLHSKTNRDNSFYKVSDLGQFARLKLIVYGIAFVFIPIIVLIAGVIFYVKQKR